ncbi:hypothetical protein PUN28_005424 [Cardiocondyla obscurior]|uniref:Uncharacterized protein n=1 Tax=Cardiocondyla obscurior TaxID=286306 RepID=A0AAW2GFX5_9HYME
MKLFDCIQCLATLNRRRSSRRSCETTDPLVITKRPPLRRQRYYSYRRAESQKIASSRSNVRFLTAIRSLGISWKRRGSSRTRGKHEACPKSARLLAGNDQIGSTTVGIPKAVNGVRLKRKRKILAKGVETSNGRRAEAGVAGRRAGELEREYYEHLEALKFLIDPPPCFRNTETRQNFENKLNSLDFRRMNTVAIPAWPETYGRRDLGWGPSGFRSPRRENGSGGRARTYADTLDRIVEEHLRIERTMLDLFARAPILKGRHGGQVSPARENKTVRFKDEVERTAVGQWAKGLRPGGEGRGGMEFDNIVKDYSDFSRAPGESSNVFDVETRNGR